LLVVDVQVLFEAHPLTNTNRTTICGHESHV
jgi:hypothetical protein